MEHTDLLEKLCGCLHAADASRAGSDILAFLPGIYGSLYDLCGRFGDGRYGMRLQWLQSARSAAARLEAVLGSGDFPLPQRFEMLLGLRTAADIGIVDPVSDRCADRHIRRAIDEAPDLSRIDGVGQTLLLELLCRANMYLRDESYLQAARRLVGGWLSELGVDGMWSCPDTLAVKRLAGMSRHAYMLSDDTYDESLRRLSARYVRQWAFPGTGRPLSEEDVLRLVAFYHFIKLGVHCPADRERVQAVIDLLCPYWENSRPFSAIWCRCAVPLVEHGMEI